MDFRLILFVNCLRIISLRVGTGPLSQLICEISLALDLACLLRLLKAETLILLKLNLLSELEVIGILLELEFAVLSVAVFGGHLHQKCLLTRRAPTLIYGMKLSVEHARLLGDLHWGATELW